jgi:hypothetical protein
MRTLAITFALLLLLPAAAIAKTGISLDPPPDGLAVGEPWDVAFQYIRNDVAIDPRGSVKPSVRITSEDTGQCLNFEAHRSYKGLWMARVYFPRAGVWHYSIEGFGRQAGRQEWDPVTITRASKPAAAAVSTSSNGSFPYGWAGGGAAIVLLAAGLAAVKLRSS